tara:strand:- start:725 stop:862 length:138 start_codon:yes stop_codon:yes gene_type:complete
MAVVAKRARDLIATLTAESASPPFLVSSSALASTVLPSLSKAAPD